MTILVWNYRWSPYNWNNLCYIHWQSQTHLCHPSRHWALHLQLYSSVTVLATLQEVSRKRGKLNINHFCEPQRALIGYSICQPWCNEMENMKQLRHGYGNMWCKCHPKYFAVLMFSLYTSALNTDSTNEMEQFNKRAGTFGGLLPAPGILFSSVSSLCTKQASNLTFIQAWEQ